MVSLFTYGSLMVPDVMEALTGKTFSVQPAAATGFDRFRISRRIYPGIARHPDALTDGRVYMNVDRTSLRLLDWFEGEFYDRQTIYVQLDDRSSIQAEAYVVANKNEECMTNERWSLDKFIAHHLQPYLARCRRLRTEYLRTLQIDGETSL